MTATLRPAKVIWATRGRSWGFRFLLDAGFEDPLSEYERAFAGASDAPTAYVASGERVAFRFPDPDSRRDSSGRVIPHEFVIMGDVANEILSVETGQRQVWPLVQDAFARTWMLAVAPRAADLRLVD